MGLWMKSINFLVVSFQGAAISHDINLIWFDVVAGLAIIWMMSVYFRLVGGLTLAITVVSTNPWNPWGFWAGLLPCNLDLNIIEGPKNIHLITKHHEISKAPQVATIHQFAAHRGDWHTEQWEEFADRVDCGVEHLVRWHQIVEPIFFLLFCGCRPHETQKNRLKAKVSRSLSSSFFLDSTNPSAVQSSPQQMVGFFAEMGFLTSRWGSGDEVGKGLAPDEPSNEILQSNLRQILNLYIPPQKLT